MNWSSSTCSPLSPKIPGSRRDRSRPTGEDLYASERLVISPRGRSLSAHAVAAPIPLTFGQPPDHVVVGQLAQLGLGQAPSAEALRQGDGGVHDPREMLIVKTTRHP
jgi:hypothetical protein